MKNIRNDFYVKLYLFDKITQPKVNWTEIELKKIKKIFDKFKINTKYYWANVLVDVDNKLVEFDSPFSPWEGRIL